MVPLFAGDGTPSDPGNCAVVVRSVRDGEGMIISVNE